MKLKGKDCLLAAGAASALLLALFYFFVHRTVMEATTQVSAEARQAQQQVTAVQNYQNAHLDMEKYMQEISEAQQRADKAMPQDLEQGIFLSRLQREALQAGLVLRQVQPGEPMEAEGGACRVLPVRVQLTGNYFQLLKFLRALGQEERFLQLRDMELKSKDGQLDCGLQLNIYAEPAS